MTNAGGYVLLHRKLLQNPIWAQCAPAVAKVAVYFLLRANYKRAQWYDGQASVDIPAGSFISSYSKVAEACAISTQQARDAFGHLSRTQFATYRRTPRWTLVTIVNWNVYQASESDENTQENIGETAQGTQRRTGKEHQIRNKEVKKKEEHTTSAAKGSGSAGMFSVDNPPFSTLDPEPDEKPTPKPSGKESLIEQYAAGMIARHPRVRSCSLTEAKSQLAKILKGVPPRECEGKLQEIDKDHASRCESEDWQKDDGQFALGLAKYLAPTMKRWERPTTTAKRATRATDDYPTLPEAR
jgi:hypothetical protein